MDGSTNIVRVLYETSYDCYYYDYYYYYYYDGKKLLKCLADSLSAVEMPG